MGFISSGYVKYLLKSLEATDDSEYLQKRKNTTNSLSSKVLKYSLTVDIKLSHLNAIAVTVSENCESFAIKLEQQKPSQKSLI